MTAHPWSLYANGHIIDYLRTNLEVQRLECQSVLLEPHKILIVLYRCSMSVPSEKNSAEFGGGGNWLLNHIYVSVRVGFFLGLDVSWYTTVPSMRVGRCR
jgi:hypothetical protein